MPSRFGMRSRTVRSPTTTTLSLTGTRRPMSQRDARPPAGLLRRLGTRLGSPFASKGATFRSTPDTADGRPGDEYLAPHPDGDASRPDERQSQHGTEAVGGSETPLMAASRDIRAASVPKISTLVPDGTVNRRALWRRGGARGLKKPLTFIATPWQPIAPTLHGYIKRRSRASQRLRRSRPIFGKSPVVAGIGCGKWPSSLSSHPTRCSKQISSES